MRPHAKGGLGEVLIAQDTELNRPIALKRIQAKHANDAANKRRFLVEAEITARLEHPGIVPVYGLVTDADGQPTYAMRFIEGDSLADAIKRFHHADGAKPAGRPRTSSHSNSGNCCNGLSGCNRAIPGNVRKKLALADV